MTDQSFPVSEHIERPYDWSLPSRLRADFLHGEVALWNTLVEAADEIERLRASLQPTPVEAARTSTTTPVCCYCDAPLSCASCGREQPDDAAQPSREAVIEECARVAESYPSSGEQTEHPVEYWIRRLSISRPQRDTL